MDKTQATLLEAVTYFADPNRAFDYALKLPVGRTALPARARAAAPLLCSSLRPVTRKLWRCKECKRQFTVKVGTIFEDSPIPFTKWLPAIWLLANTKNGTSSHELGRALGVTQKTAWFMFHRIRQAMKDTTQPPFAGEVEADETFVGGRHRSTMTTGRGFRKVRHGPSEGKATVFGMVQRGAKGQSRVRAMVAKSLLPPLFANVVRGSRLYTDAWGPYHGADHAFVDEFVDHSIKYVEGRVHTNNIENFWACLKRTLQGTYIAPRPFHLDAYLDEQVFRFNAGERNDAERFIAVAKRTEGRRLTYSALTNAHSVWRLKPGRVAKSPTRLHQD